MASTRLSAFSPAHLKEEGRATIGFEAPLWTPRRANLEDITKARGGVEKGLSRAWTAQVGPRVIALALALMPWVFERVAKCAPEAKETVGLDRWHEPGGLFVLAAFVSGASGAAKRATHGEGRGRESRTRSL